MKNFIRLLGLLILTSFNIKAIDFIVDDINSFFNDVNPGDGICLAGFSSTCTLLAAIQETNALAGSHRIILANETYVTNPNTFEIINSDVEIVGVGMNDTIIDGNNNGQVFNLYESNVTFKDLSIINGKATVDNPTGGGIYASSGILGTANLIISNVKFRNNSANLGGAVRTNDMMVTINHSSFSENTLEDLGVTNMFGSAISTRRGILNIYSSSIHNNTNGRDAIFVDQGFLQIENSTVSNHDSIGLLTQNTTGKITFSTFSDNTSQLSHFSFDGTEILEINNSVFQNATSTNCISIQKPVSLGYNISDDTSCEMLETTDMQSTDALLGALADNGGTSLSHKPAAISPAVDNVPLASCLDVSDEIILDFDQRGAMRPVASLCDSGAIELTDIIFKNGFE